MPKRKAPTLSYHRNQIAALVLWIRGEKVILDSDLAQLYGVATKTLNQAVRRNIDRFPSDFMVQLTKEEWEQLRSQIATTYTQISDTEQLTDMWSQTVTTYSQDVDSALIANNRSQIATDSIKYRRDSARPYAFTEQGVAMLSSVLKSPHAIEVMYLFLHPDGQAESNSHLRSRSDISSLPCVACNAKH